MLSTLQNVRGSQGTLLTQRKRSFHRLKTLTDTAPKRGILTPPPKSGLDLI